MSMLKFSKVKHDGWNLNDLISLTKVINFTKIAS